VSQHTIHLSDQQSGGSTAIEDKNGNPISPDASSGGHHHKATADDYRGVDNLGSLLDSIPALQNLVNQAIAHGWSANRFQNAVQDSDWWKNHSATARAVIIQRANDPQSYRQSLHNTTATVSSLAHNLGFHLSSSQLNAISLHALMTGNDGNQNWLTQQIGARQSYGHVKDTSSLNGGMATAAQQVEQMAAQYGFKYSPAQIAARAQQIVMGNQTIDAYQEDLKKWAKGAFPPLADQIDRGMTVHDLAAPYVSSMSQLLELDPGTLDAFNPAIRRAMQGVVPAGGKPGQKEAMNLNDFEEQVRRDPRWQYTQNAKDTMSSVLVKIGQDFGFGV
jgi:hypothetical protein